MTDWVSIETAILREARLRLQLSYEAVARLIPVSSKTYERWEKRGRIPRGTLQHVAEILRLEIEAPELPPLRVSSPPDDHADLDFQREVLVRLDRIEKLLSERLAS